jgi:D-amino-acid dehydrogenase
MVANGGGSIVNLSSIAGIIVALHLQQRDRDVILIDRRGAGEETSYGNSGLIQHQGVAPYTFPRQFGTILNYAMNHRRDAVYHLSALPRLAPWLFRYWQNAAPQRIERSARALAPLMARCVDEHEALTAEAGSAGRALVRQNGWIRRLRTEASLHEKIAEAPSRPIRDRLRCPRRRAVARARAACFGKDRRSDPLPRFTDLV